MPRGKAQRSWHLIQACYGILEEIRPATLRAVCYRLFVRGLMPSMAEKKVDGVGEQVKWAREHEVIPWEWVVHDTRAAERVSAWAEPAAFIEAVGLATRTTSSQGTGIDVGEFLEVATMNVYQMVRRMTAALLNKWL